MCWYESKFFGYQTNKVWWFTGIILLPGSFSGRMSSPRPHRGPLQKNIVKTTKVKQICESREKWIIQLCTDLPNNRMSFAIFIREVATVLSAPLVSTKASCAACKKKHTALACKRILLSLRIVTCKIALLLKRIKSKEQSPFLQP